MDDQQQPIQLNIEISEEVAEGSYANLAIITHSHAEFVIDFVNVMPGTPKSRVKSRIILTPQHAKRLMKALTENIGKYEAANGTIKDLEEIQLPLNFGGPTAQAWAELVSGDTGYWILDTWWILDAESDMLSDCESSYDAILETDVVSSLPVKIY